MSRFDNTLQARDDASRSLHAIRPKEYFSLHSAGGNPPGIGPTSFFESGGMTTLILISVDLLFQIITIILSVFSYGYFGFGVVDIFGKLTNRNQGLLFGCRSLVLCSPPALWYIVDAVVQHDRQVCTTNCLRSRQTKGPVGQFGQYRSEMFPYNNVSVTGTCGNITP